MHSATDKLLQQLASQLQISTHPTSMQSHSINQSRS